MNLETSCAWPAPHDLDDFGSSRSESNHPRVHHAMPRCTHDALATYRRDGSIDRHLCNTPDSADDRFAAVVMRSSKRLTG